MTSTPHLIESLNALAPSLLSLPQDAAISFGPGVSAANHFWEVFDGFRGEFPTSWTIWLDQLKYGEWPSNVDFSNQDIAVAVACFAGNETRKHYRKLVREEVRSIAIKMVAESTSMPLVEKCHIAMMSNLSIQDRNYFLLVESLGIDWYSHWSSRRTVTPLCRDSSLPYNIPGH